MRRVEQQLVILTLDGWMHGQGTHEIERVGFVAGLTFAHHVSVDGDPHASAAGSQGKRVCVKLLGRPSLLKSARV